MIVLGIESSANKLGIGIVDDKKILSNLRVSYSPPKGHGFIPTDVSEHHRSSILGLFSRSLREAKIKISQIDAIAYTRGPGMQQLLAIGYTVAKTLSILLGKPLVPVNHCVAHIEMGRLVTNAQNPVILYVSGGNTQIIAYHEGKYRIFGETLDIAVGNCLDKIARILDLENYPSPGLSIEKMARESTNYIPLPYCVKGMDMTFSGLLSYVKKIANDEKKEDLCYSVQETIFSMLIEGTERCLSLLGTKEVLIVGGVGCNLRLQKMMEKMLEERNGILYSTDERFCIDNGAMIAYTGHLILESSAQETWTDGGITQRFRTDTVDVTWRTQKEIY